MFLMSFQVKFHRPVVAVVPELSLIGSLVFPAAQFRFQALVLSAERGNLRLQFCSFVRHPITPLVVLCLLRCFPPPAAGES